MNVYTKGVGTPVICFARLQANDFQNSFLVIIETDSIFYELFLVFSNYKKKNILLGVLLKRGNAMIINLF